MNQIKINDKENFINSLFRGDIFDNLLLDDVTLFCDITVKVDGKTYPDFEQEHYIPWKSAKQMLFDILSDRKTLNGMNILLRLNPDKYESLIENDSVIKPSDIQAAFLKINLTDGILNVTSSLSLSIFSMEKGPEHKWDSIIESTLSNYQ